MEKKMIEVKQIFKKNLLDEEKIVLGDHIITKSYSTNRFERPHIELEQNLKFSNDEDYVYYDAVKLGNFYITFWKHPTGEHPDYIGIEFYKVNPNDENDYESFNLFVQMDGLLSLNKEKDFKETSISEVSIEQLKKALDVEAAVKTIESIFK